MATYSPLEERLNILTHAIGIPASAVGLILMLTRSELWSSYVSAIVFGLSMLVLYTASTTYHAATLPERRARLRVFDHSAIFILIAGTYTPISLITLKGDIGTIILIVIWSLAAMGVILKIFFTGRFGVVSTILYVLMGWVIIFAFKPLGENLAPSGVFWMIAGGVSYTVGAILYSIKAIPYNHAIFHVFVLGGTFCHFLSIYNYVLL